MTFVSSKSVAVAFLAFVLHLAADAQSVSFQNSAYSSHGGYILGHTDLNGDAQDDFVVVSQDPSLAHSFFVVPSKGNGTYGTPIENTIPNGTIFSVTFGDFNRDGKQDLVTVSNNSIYFYAGKGDGTFAAPVIQNVSTQTGVQFAFVVAEDFNRDGKLDLAVSADGNPTLRIFLGNGDGTFAVGATYSNVASGSDLYGGDFDGDAKADIAGVSHHCDSGVGCHTEISMLYGDGTAHFTQKPVISDSQHEIAYVAADANNDGKMDLVGASNNSGGGFVRLLLGTASRTFTTVNVPASVTLSDTEHPAVADINGDGRSDLVVIGFPNNTTRNVYVKLRNSDGTYKPEQIAYSSGTGLARLNAVRTNPDTKADLAISEQNASSPGYILRILQNSTAAVFASCNPPNSFTGIRVCSPTGVSGSPVHFGVGAANFTPLRKVEVWVDGSKRAEKYYSFSDYAFLDSNLSLASGNHIATIYAAAWDNTLRRSSFSFSVGGSTCPQPSSSTATVICSPANGSTVSNPVSVQARGGSSVTFMEVWVDGTKRFQISGNSVSTSLTLAAGSHHLTVFGKNGSTVLSKATSDFTVK